MNVERISIAGSSPAAVLGDIALTRSKQSQVAANGALEHIKHSSASCKVFSYYNTHRVPLEDV